MVDLLRKERRILLVSLAIGIFFAMGVAASTYVYSAAVQREIAENVIRFHVVAHSDSPEEQELKEYVRTEILANFAHSLSANADISTTRSRLEEVLPAMREHAQETVSRVGFGHEVTAEMATVFFPTQFYGNIAFPPGYYEAVQIIIGDGVGQNWWCLMFPPLCYVDMTTTDAGQALLSETISEETFLLLMHQESASPELTVRFRVVEWWQNRS
ncbi:MAG: stage II sporulation protein R [Defluviitaleaceae bacterium]|nr:stage II sporulation protein R [Defluviitaleaceae bacterium]MCL2263063.1 stage II sporulation protein R [Defluviitaleaceae bacterium]